MASSRIRPNPSRLYDLYVEVAAPTTSETPSFILTQYPSNYADQPLLATINKFIFPCGQFNKVSEAVQHVSFVKTDEDGTFTFGYCRHTPSTNTCLCLLTALPWTNFFFKLLDHFALVMNTRPSTEFDDLLRRTYDREVPNAGEIFMVDSSLGLNKFEYKCHDDTKLPTIQDNRHLLEYFSAVDQLNMMRIFANMLRERRIIFTGSKLNQISSCVFAANLLIFPLHWQFMFFPSVPMLDVLGATIPFIAGVATCAFNKAIDKHIFKFDDVVVLDIDSKQYSPPRNESGQLIDDLASLPVEVISVLNHNLKNSNYIGDGLARSFLRAMVTVLGNYRQGLVRDEITGDIAFNAEKLWESSTITMKPFIHEVFISNSTRVQAFQQFMEERVDLIKSAKPDAVLDDEFEQERKVFELKTKSKMPEIIMQTVTGGITGLQRKMSDLAKDSTAMFPSTSIHMKQHLRQLKPRDSVFGIGNGIGKRNSVKLKMESIDRIEHPNFEMGQEAAEEPRSKFIDDPDIKAVMGEQFETPVTDNSKPHVLRGSRSTIDLVKSKLKDEANKMTSNSSTDLMLFDSHVDESELSMDDFDPLKSKNLSQVKPKNNIEFMSNVTQPKIQPSLTNWQTFE